MITKKEVQSIVARKSKEEKESSAKQAETFLTMMENDVRRGRLVNSKMVYQHTVSNCPETQKLIIKALKKEGFAVSIETREIQSTTKRKTGKVTTYNKTISMLSVDLLS